MPYTDAAARPTSIRFLIALLAAALAAGILGAPAAARIAEPAEQQATPDAVGLDFGLARLAGPNRYATAAAISQYFYNPGVPLVFVATGEEFPDALAVGPAADSQGAPVLFVRHNRVPAETIAEIQRLQPPQIVVVGGPEAVSGGVFDYLAGLAPNGATRVAGADRYATAGEIAATYFASTPVVWVATGERFPDALAAGAAAAVQGGPVLLSRSGSLPDATAAQLDRLRPSTIAIAGGPAAVSADVEAALEPYAGNVIRLGGADRFATAAAISEHVFPNGAEAAFLATGRNFPDALAAIPAAGLMSGPILLTTAGSIPLPAQNELERLAPSSAYVLGGRSVVLVGVQKLVQGMLGACYSGFKPPAGTPEVHEQIPSSANVALTFDMGGRLDPALEIVNWLIDHQVCSTIFLTGDASSTPEGREVVALINENLELFEIGNHTMNHCNLRDGGGTAGCPTGWPSAGFIVNELQAAENVIVGLTGRSTIPYWRPPYGATDASVQSAAASAGWTETIMWDVDPLDWQPESQGGPTTQEIADTVLSQSSGGSIVLMHLGGYNTLDALPAIVEGLRARGQTPTTISDMLES